MILKKRTIISLITTSLLLTPALTSASELEEAYDYGDIDETSSHYEGVQWVSQFGIQGYPIEGTNDRKYGVGEDLSRKHASKFFTLVSGLEVPNSSLVETYFKDVSAEHPYASYIGAVAAKGIFGGDNGIFNPEDIMKRQHMAKTIVESYGLKNTGEEIDVNLDNIHESYHEYITILAQHGITTELEDFRPGEAVTRTQFATFLYRANQAVEGLPTETPEPTEPENPEQPVEEFEKLQLDFPFDLAVNQEEKITFYGIEEDGSKKDITSLATFKVADQTVVTIEDGLIHAVSKGSTEVTAIYKDYQTIVNVTVADIEQPTDPVIPDQADSEGIERIEVYSAGRVAVNQTAPVHLGAYYEGNNVVDISSLATVEIENPEVLAYEHGLLRGISLGTTEITIKYKGFEDSMTIEVIYEPEELSGYVYSVEFPAEIGLPVDASTGEFKESLQWSIDKGIGYNYEELIEIINATSEVDGVIVKEDSAFYYDREKGEVKIRWQKAK